MIKVPVHTEFIKLDSFLKFAGAVQTGGEAKERVQGGEVRVNGEVCLQRGKKLHVHDIVTIEEKSYEVAEREA